MEVILYLSNQLVQAVEVKKKGRKIMVRRVWQEEAPGGSIINGIITDEEAFLPFIKSFFSRNKIPSREVSLVIGSSQFNHKVMEFPRLSDRELRKLIEREFAENKKKISCIPIMCWRKREGRGCRRSWQLLSVRSFCFPIWNCSERPE